MPFGLLFGLLGFDTPPDVDDLIDNLQQIAPAEISEQEQLQEIQTNFRALIIMIVLVSLIALAVFLINKRAGKKRYAAHQAKLAAEGRLDSSNALTEIAYGGAKPRFINDDDAAAPEGERPIAQVFGENYRPYGKDGLDAAGT